MQYIDGKKLSKELLLNIKKRVAVLSFKPIFVDVLVGNDLASAQYVAMKYKMAISLGIEVLNVAFPETISTEELVVKIHELAAMPRMAGIIVQLPLPKHVDAQAVFDAIPVSLDVDILGKDASSAFYNDQSDIIYPAAQACYELLKVTGSLEEKNIVVIGQGKLVGRPVTHLLHRDGYIVTTVVTDTQNKAEIIKNADVIISAAGVPHLITGDQIKEGVILIDAGTTEQDGGVVGDIDTESVRDVAGYLAPVPGGVGPMTVALLLENVVIVAEQKQL